MVRRGRVELARLALLLAVVAAGVAGCNMRAIPGLTTPDYALSTPAPLLPPGAEPILTAPPGIPVDTSQPYTLDSGDRLRIIVFGQENLSGLYSVDASGCVALPLIGPVSARGLTTFELAANIGSLLRRKYLKDPQVAAEVETYRPFFILGEVNKPGQYPYVTAMTVENAVAVGEGYTERARQRMVRLTRRFGGVLSTVMVPTDYPIRPGDTIYVLERWF
jgi:polysaccharide biosynthesis/export protein